MARKFFLLKLFLTLISVQYIFLNEVEASVGESITTVPSTIVDDHTQSDVEENESAVSDLKDLIQGLDHISKVLENSSKSPPPKLIPDLLSMINNFIGVKELRESLRSIWPKFWKVSRREKCEKILNEEIVAYIAEFDASVQEDYYAYIDLLKSKLSRTSEDLKQILAICAKNGENCIITPEDKDKLEAEIKYVGGVFYGLEEHFRLSWENWVIDHVYDKIIPYIKACADD